MLVELGGKGGRVCQPALDGTLRCPLIIRPNSEDAITGNLCGVLQAIQPRHWLPHFLNHALRAKRFRSQVYRNLKIELWQRQPVMPAHLVPWKEGSTEVDVVITWENPPTTVFLEMKYKSELSATTTHHVGRNGFPADQLVRNARVGLYRNGWYAEPRLFEMPSRDFVLLLVSPTPQQKLVEQYRDPAYLRQSIPQGHLLERLPQLPFMGQINYQDIIHLLSKQSRHLVRSERILVTQLVKYLQFKTDSENYTLNEIGTREWFSFQQILATDSGEKSLL